MVEKRSGPGGGNQTANISQFFDDIAHLLPRSTNLHVITHFNKCMVGCNGAYACICIDCGHPHHYALCLYLGVCTKMRSLAYARMAAVYDNVLARLLATQETYTDKAGKTKRIADRVDRYSLRWVCAGMSPAFTLIPSLIHTDI